MNQVLIFFLFYFSFVFFLLCINNHFLSIISIHIYIIKNNQKIKADI